MKPVKHLIVAALLAALPSLAFAQATLLQGGSWTAGHAPMYSVSGGSTPVVQDSGTSAGGATGLGLSELAIVNRSTTAASGNGPAGEHFCQYSGPTTGAYYFLCMDPNGTGGNGVLNYGAAGGASTGDLVFTVNGTDYTFPFVTGGVIGPGTTVVGDTACWNNTIGTLLSDCGQIKLNGATSGTVLLKAAAIAGSNTLTLPAGTTDFSATGGTSQVVKQTSAGGAFTVGMVAASDISNGTTGTGAVVLQNTPTLITPVIGAATGTSLNVTGTLTGTTAVRTTDLGTDSASTLNVTTSGGTQAAVSNTASAVNYYSITGAVAQGSGGTGPVLSVGGSDTNINANIAAKGNGSVLFNNENGAHQFAVANTASSVNYFRVTGSITGNTPVLTMNGSDTNISGVMTTKGTGNWRFATNTDNANLQFAVNHTASSVNYAQVTGAGGGSAPTISTTGSDTDVSLQISPKGVGNVLLGTMCTVTGTTPQTCNGQRGIVTTGTLTTAAATATTYVINNSSVSTSSLVLCTDQGYSGTYVTNGYPVIMECKPGSGTITVGLTNTHSANALNGTLKFGFAVLN